MKCKTCGGNLLFCGEDYQCENCGEKSSVSAVFADVEVFLLCRDMDDQGRRTETSLRAEELYAKLESAKLNVFFPFRSLGDLCGDDAEIVCNAAMKSARVVLLLGRTPEDFSFLLKEKESLLQEKQIIPLFFKMEAKEIPSQLSSIQSINIEQVGFEKNLIASLYHLLGKKEKKSRLPLIITLSVVLGFLVLASAFLLIYLKTDLFSKPETNQAVKITEESDEEKYKKAISLSEEGRYADAIKLFLELGEYQDSANRLLLLYASYSGYYEAKEGAARLHFTREGDDTVTMELVFLNENGKQIKILEAASLSGVSCRFDFTDSEGNAGSVSLTLQNEGIEIKIKTEEKNGDLFIEDQTVLFSLALRSDKSPTERVTKETLFEWLSSGATFQDLLRQGIELEFVYDLTDGGATMPQSTTYQIKGTQIQLDFPRYDTRAYTSDRFQIEYSYSGDFGVNDWDEVLPIQQCLLYAVCAPASVLTPEKVGSSYAHGDYWEENGFLFLPDVLTSDNERNPFWAPYWSAGVPFYNNIYVPGYGEYDRTPFILTENMPVGVVSQAAMHPSVYEYAKKYLAENRQNTIENAIGSHKQETDTTARSGSGSTSASVSPSAKSFDFNASYSSYQEAYALLADYLCGPNFGGLDMDFYFIYLNQDDIPDLYVSSGVEAAGEMVFVCYHTNSAGVKVIQQQLSRCNGAQYIPKSGLIRNTNGNMGYYRDEVYKFENGVFQSVLEGSITEDYDDNSGWTGAYTYRIGSEVLGQDAYQSRFDQVFNSSIAVKPYANKMNNTQLKAALSAF